MSLKLSDIAQKGAMMFETLVVLGIMVLVTPIIISGVSRRNEKLQSRVIASEINNLQGAAGNYVSFNREEILENMKNTNIKVIEGDKLKSELVNYGLSPAFKMINQLDMIYGLIMEKGEDDTLNAFIFSKVNGYLNAVRRNEIVNGLGFLGAVLDESKEVVSNVPDYIIPTRIKSYLKPNTILMKIDDEILVKEYMASMAIDELGSIMNTMMVSLYLEGNDIKNVNTINADSINVSKGIDTFYLVANDFTNVVNLKALDLDVFSHLVLDYDVIFTTESIGVYDLSVGEVNVHNVDIKGDVKGEIIDVKNIELSSNAKLDNLGYLTSFVTDVFKVDSEDGKVQADKFFIEEAVIIDKALIAGGDLKYEGGEQIARIAPARKDSVVKDILIDGQSLSDQIMDVYTKTREIYSEYQEEWPGE